MAMGKYNIENEVAKELVRMCGDSMREWRGYLVEGDKGETIGTTVTA